MKNIFGGFFNKKKAVKMAQHFEKPAKPEYDFVEQYTIVDPKKVLIGGYDLFAGCEKIPVVCEESEESSMGFRQGIMLPTKCVIDFLCQLQEKTPEEIADPKKRTISIVHISKNHQMVIVPNLKSPKTPFLRLIAEKAPAKEWVLHITPAKNRAIVDALKIHTR